MIAHEGQGAASGHVVVVDLHAQRTGCCYLTTWDTSGLAGAMPVVARSMHELFYWLLPPPEGEPRGPSAGGLGDALTGLSAGSGRSL